MLQAPQSDVPQVSSSIVKLKLNKLSFFNRNPNFGILIVNISGCFLLGLFYHLMDSNLERYLTPLLFIGFLGAFTTFSAFSKESLELLYQGNFLMALLYVILSVSSCLGATWLGMYLTRVS